MKQTALGNDFLPELDRKATQKTVEAALEKYRILKYIAVEERDPKITASPEPRYHGPTNATSDQTGEIATYNADIQAARKAYCEQIERAVSRLPRMEAFLIRERYMTADADYLTDYAVYTQRFQPPISENTYAKIRWRAFYKLALSLNIAVIKEVDKDGGNQVG